MGNVKKISFLFYIVVIQFCVLKLNAQSLFFQNYSVEDGLPFMNVSTIFQDNKGNLWSGGYGGLSKFDGNSFTNFSPRHGLLNHAVSTITQDDKGNLWIGTIGGINKYDGKNFVGYTVKNGLSSNFILSSCKDLKGNLWFGTDKGINKLIGEKFIHFSKKNGLIGDIIKCLFQDRSGNIWIGTMEGISVFNGKTFFNYNTQNGLPSNNINGISQDSNNNIWLATADGICSFNGEKFTTYNKQQGLSESFIRAILVDHRNTVWLATNNGLIKFQNNTFENYSIRRDPNSNSIGCLYEDYEHNLWIGTYSGLFKYRGNPFILYGIDDGLKNSFIFGILRDSKNTLWVGSQAAGLFKYQNKKFIQFSNGLNATGVSMIYEYAPGVLWLATDAGLRIFNGERFIQQKDTSAVFRTQVNCIYKDSKNNIWLGGDRSVFKYDGKKFTSFPIKSLSEDFQVWTFVEDKKGVLWIGTYLGGLIKYDGKSFVECSKQLNLTSDSYLASLVDRDGNLYFGTLDGLWMFDPTAPQKKPIHFDERDGMSSNLMYALTFGSSENEIWIGTNQGLNRLDIATYKNTGKKNIVRYSKQEGFLGVECNGNGTFVDKDSCIWFGTVYGAVKYNPREYIKNTLESKTSITGFRLFYTDTILTNNTRLPYYQNSITFNYSGICLTNPDQVKYSHILEGFEKKWSPPAKERFTTYSNLPPGKYTYKLISSNNEGVFNKTPVSFTFTIEPPFWKTWIFRISMIGIICLIVFSFIRFRIRAIKMREISKTELNKKIANIELQALRAQMNPHFIFNTLSSIQHYISNNDTDAALKYLSKFAKLMRRIMDNSKQQMISVDEELQALNLYLELETMRFEQKFQYSITLDVGIDRTYDKIPSMLIQPYVENAIIHGLLPKQSNGKLSIDLEKQYDTILCTIEDNGIGREKAMEFKKNRIYHQSMGMSITEERLGILNSSLNSNINVEIIDLFENGIASGTRVRLIIPLEESEK